MEKTITHNRTPYQQSIMTATYPGVAREAIIRGFDGSWERLIAQRLRIDAKSGISEAEVLLQYCEGDALKAAYLVTNSKIIS
jgi:hypothetical protein